MLELTNINVWYGKNHVLRNLSCRVKAGDIIVVLGNNGAGKSSFFNCIAGALKPQSGAIKFNTTDITKINEQNRSKLISRLFQNTSLNSVGTLTVEQNLALALYSNRMACLKNGMSGMPRNQALELLRSLGMEPIILQQTMNSLSGGQRQLISFVMATLQKPQLLLLDEPTAALDPQAATKLLCYALKHIKKHAITTLLITHDPHLALAVGNKIWILENGTIMKQFDEHEKNDLNPQQLLGQIDYTSIANSTAVR